MPEAVEPVRKVEWAPAAPAARGRALAAPPLPFDLAQPERPALDPRAGVALGRLSVALPVVAAADAAPVAAPHAPALRFGHADPQLIRDAAQDALRQAADALDLSPQRFAEAAPLTAPERAPSRNHLSSEASLSHAFLARDEAGDLLTLDLHLARLGPSLWEAAAFDHAGAGPAGFPYAGEPLDVTRLHFDPRAGAFAVPEPHRGLQVFVPPEAQPATPRAPPPRIAWPVLAGAALVAAAFFLGMRS